MGSVTSISVISSSSGLLKGVVRWGFVQLSDIHLKNDENVVVDRVAQIKGALQGAELDFDACFIAVTGDIAWSGQATEYAIAYDFLNNLHDAIASVRSDLYVEEVLIPGNHDCDFAQHDQVRQILLDNALQTATAPYNFDDSLVNTCLKVQNNFFNFVAARSNDSTELAGNNRLYYVYKFKFGDTRIKFNCYNTAWMSRRNEQQGKLLVSTTSEVNETEKYDLIVTMFHHPYNWMEANNAKALKKVVEQASDIIMTGHEHESDRYSKHTMRGENNEYFEGAVLQNNTPSESGFNIIVLDIENRQHKSLCYSWQGSYYARHEESEWQSFERNKRLGIHQFENTDEYARYLTDPGATFTHPQKNIITLSDIFVYPDLKDRSYTKSSQDETLSLIVRGDRILNRILDDKHIVISGSEKAGKTTLAKSLYVDLQKSQLVPLLIPGEMLKNHEATAFIKVVDKCVAEQYGRSMVELYRQLDKNSKVLLIDDVHQSPLNRKGLNSIVRAASIMFDKTIVFANEFFELQQIAYQDDEQSVLMSFRHYEIQELGHRLRGKLIEKWYSLGQEYTSNEIDIGRRINHAENIINTLLGRNLLPSYSIFILALLQSFEAETNHNTALGSYGYHYEALITAALTAASKSVGKKITLDTLYTYLSKVAYRMFERKSKYLTESEFNQITQEYQQQYKMPFSIDTMMKILGNARMIRKDVENNYYFTYKYIYYYFTAKYMSENLYTSSHESRLRDQAKEMISKVYVEANSNIILFLVYLTKDEKIISQILSDARALYIEHEPCDLDKSVAFINQLSKISWQLQLGNGRPQDNKQEYREHLDEAERTRPKNIEDETEDFELREQHEVDNIFKINVAFKTLQIMGQILRNFPGALQGDVKLQIAEESYLLGLRSLQTIFSFFEQHLDQVRETLFEFVRSDGKSENDRDVSQRVDELTYYILHILAYTFIRRVSQAVGSEHLEETYKEIQDARIPVSISLIDMSIKLDHFQTFPKNELIKLYNSFRKNHFASTLLRLMVRDHLYLYPTDWQTRQSICEKLDIRVNDPKLFDTTNRKSV
jgi:hypothetical protein